MGSSSAVVPRPRLHERLGSAECVALIAPSGFGKSTLLREWALEREAAGDAVAWVPLTEPPSSATEFWKMLVRACDAAGAVGEAHDVAVRIGVGEDPVEAVAEALSPGGCLWLLVDAFEHAADLGVAEALLRLGAAQPRIRLVVAARSAPELADPVLQARFGLDVIGPASLALRQDEVAAILGRSGATDAAERVHRDTGGYPLAVRAYLLGERDLTGLGRGADAHGRVAGALLDLVSPRQRTFVSPIAAAPFFDLALASTLSAEAEGEVEGEVDELVRTLERDGLGRWIPYGAQRRLFQYSDAVRGALLREAHADSTAFEVASTHVARWLLELGDYESALRAALTAHEYSLASEAVGRLMATNPMTYMSTMLAPRLRDVDPDSLDSYPTLAFGYALALLAGGVTRSAAKPYFEISARADASHPGVDAGPHSLGPVRVGSLRALRRFREAAEEASLAVAAIREDRHPRGIHAREGQALAYRQFSYTLLQDGQIEQAREVAQLAIGRAERPWSQNQSYAWAAGVDAVDGRRRAADALLHQVDPAAWPTGHADSYLNGPGRVAAAFCALDDFKFEQALSEYDGCAFVETSEFWPFITTTRLMAAVGLGRASAEALRLSEQLAASDLPPGLGDNLGSAMLRGTLAVAWLVSGRVGPANEQLDAPTSFPGQLAPARMLRQLVGGESALVLRQIDEALALPGHTVRSRAALHAVAAAAALREERPRTVRDLLEGDAMLHQLYGVRAHLTLLPRRDLTALRSAFGDGAFAAYLGAPVDGLDYPERIALTEREVEVLTALVHHRTREQVAAALHLSVNTVKVHLRTAYKKMGARTRDEAIERFRELGPVR